MGIPLTRESEDMGAPCERCCFCRRVTAYWTALEDRAPGEQVACCAECSRHALPADVPTKAGWCRRERIAAPTQADRADHPAPRISWPTGRPTPAALREAAAGLAKHCGAFTGKVSVAEQLYALVLARLGAMPATGSARQAEVACVSEAYAEAW